MNELLFPPEVQLQIQRIEQGERRLDIYAISHRDEAVCPTCHTRSGVVHGRYWRHPQDLPCFGLQVKLHIAVYRFLCAEKSCARQTFADRLTEWLPYRARRTTRLQEQHRAIAYELGGEAGRRLTQALQMPISGDTLIRAIRQTPETAVPTAKVIGIDDWAMRKGHTYGTIVVDLESHRPVDLLPARDVDTVVAWLQTHGEIEVISRDRGREYVKAASLGAPQATQVADRWHLLLNLRQAIERFLQEKPGCLQAAAQETTLLDGQDEPVGPRTVVNETPVTNPPLVEPEPVASEPPVEKREDASAGSTAVGLLIAMPEQLGAQTTSKAEAAKVARHQRRQERYDKVRELHQAGLSHRAIARQLSLSPRTVQKYVTADQCPQYPAGRNRYSQLTPWLPYLEKRWQSGCTNATQLWRELEVQGFQGSRRLVGHWAADQRKLLPVDSRYSRQQPDNVQPQVVRQVQPPPWSAQRASWLIVLNDDRLDAQEQAARTRLLAADKEVTTADRLARQFVQMVKERREDALSPWLAEVSTSGIQALKSFAQGIRDDLTAVRNGLRLSWSQGQTEGQVNRLKFLKRQMYGRAKFDLLRKRVLYQPLPG